MLYLYHRVPRYGQHGNVLYPLNVLRLHFPEAYEEHKEKYNNRLYELDRIVPPLNCLWNDVLYFSVVHPYLIKEALAQSGYKVPVSLEYYQINPALLDPAHTVIYLFSKPVFPYKQIDPAEFISYIPKALAEYTQVTPLAKQHYSSNVQAGRAPLLYLGIPHVLFRGILDTTDIERVTI